MAIEWKRMHDQKKILGSLPLDHPHKEFEYEQCKHYRNQRSLYLWSSLVAIFLSTFHAYTDAPVLDFVKKMEKIEFKIYQPANLYTNCLSKEKTLSLLGLCGIYIRG